MGLRLLHLNLHGLIRSHDLELGRDSDTGGQTLYVLELVKSLANKSEVERVDLVTRLIRDKKVASYADSGYSMFSRNDPLFLIDINPLVGEDTEKIQKELDAIILDLQTNLVHKKELDRIKAQVLASEVYQRDSIDYQARILGMIKTSIGDIGLIDKYTENINKVTASQVRSVAKKYLVSNLKTIVTVNDEK